MPAPGQVLGRALQHLLDLVLEAERHAPHDRVVRLWISGIADSSTTWPIDRACAIVFSSVRRYAASIATIIAPSFVRAGIAPDITNRTTALAASADPDQHQAARRQVGARR